MKKLFKGLLAMAIALGSNAMAKDHSNKTFLMPRPGGSVDLPMEHTAWDNFVNHKKKKNDKKDKAFGGNLNITGFYNESQSGKDLGKYFGPCCKAECPPTPSCDTKCSSEGCDGYVFSLERADARFTPGILSVDDVDFNLGDATDPGAAFSKEAGCVDLGYIIHNANFLSENNGNKKDKVTLGFKPEHNVWGVRFDYYQDLQCILKGLFFRANLPVVEVENNMNFAVCSQDFDTTKEAIQDYFRGNKVKIAFNPNAAISDTNPDTNNSGCINQQEKLCKAKICGKQSESGVADIDLALGYKFLDKKNYHADLAFAITIPTGNTPDGQWLFEPVVGNGGHFGIGFDADFYAHLWEKDDQNIRMYLRLKYRYLLEDCEHRVLGLGTKGGPTCPTDDCTTNCDTSCNTACDTDCNDQRPWGHYTLLGCAGTTPKTALIPAANILCQKVDVTPGSQFDGIIGFNYNYKGFNFDLGYNLYYREAEKVCLKNARKDDCNTSCNTSCDVTCPDLSIYSVAARGHITANNSTLDNGNAFSIDATDLTNNAENNDYIHGPLGFPADQDNPHSQALSIEGCNGTNVNFNQSVVSVLTGNNDDDVEATADAANAQRPSHVDGNDATAAKLNDGTKVLTCVAETPSQLTHSIFGGIGYAFLDWDYPVLLRLGAKYEWKDDNASIERFGIWGGIGIGF